MKSPGTCLTQHTNMELNLALSSVLILLCLTLHSTNAVTYTETLGMGQSIKISDTLVSANGNFELGFFAKMNLTKYYVGIRYKKIPKDNIVWVANRNGAASDNSSAVFTIDEKGNLVVKDDRIEYSVTMVSNISSTHAVLLDSGNLVLLNNSNLNLLWQSFDDPTDTILPGMMVGTDTSSAKSLILTSWTSAEDPSPGVFSVQIGTILPDDGLWYTDIKTEPGDDDYRYYRYNHFTFKSYKGNLTWKREYSSRLVLEVSGELKQQLWLEDKKQWISLESSTCTKNASCGDFSICNPQALDPCECLKGFTPYDSNSWKQGNTSTGCVRKTELRCTNTSDNGLDDGYFPLDKVDFLSGILEVASGEVDFVSNSLPVFQAENASTCQITCSKSCSCVAYAYNFTGYCFFWHDRLLNLINATVDIGDDHNRTSVFLKLAASELISNELNSRNEPGPKVDDKFNYSQKVLYIIIIPILLVTLLTLALFTYCYRKRKLKGKGEDLLLFDVGMSMKVNSSELTDLEKTAKVNKREVKLPLFSFASVSAATDNFSIANKLGEGGFGPVYKAWDLWTSGRGIELMDSVIEDASINKMEVLRYVNIALLCVQESAAERPTMADVVSLLGNDNAVLPDPKSIAFLNVRGTSTSLDIISPSQSIQDGESETLVSAGGTYELGFFSPGSSKGRYMGIWYKESPSTVVWVANRETQLNNTSGVLRVNDEGVLVLVSGTNSIVWLSNVSRKASNPIAQLLDSGNLVVRNENDSNLDNLLWQSFDYPCDTFLPGMKMGKNLETGVERFFSSWKSADDPGQGDCRYKVDHRGYPQGVQLKGNNLIARVGSWNGLTFTGCQAQVLRPKYELMLNGKEVYFEYKLLNESALSRFIISPSGTVQQFFWKGQTSSWEFVLSEPTDQCENYGLCGANSICNIINAPVCECLKGFVPKNPVDWNKSYWSKGCIRRIPLECNNSDRFQKYMGMKLPDTSSSWYSKTMDLKDCQESCLKNCSCTAYANLDIRNGGSGCLLWFDRVIDMRQHLQGGQELYIRLSASELDLTIDHGHDKFHKKKLYIGLGVGSSVLVMGLMALGFSTDIWKKKLHKAGKAIIFYWKHNKSKLRNVDIDLPTFDLSIIGEATNNFSSSNKLGEGGFGPVYKAWRLWTEEKPLELIDEFLEEKSTPAEVIRCMHVGLLCVQQKPEDRPDMSSVVLMLNGEKLLSKPNAPGFYSGRDLDGADFSNRNPNQFSPNEMSLMTYRGTLGMGQSIKTSDTLVSAKGSFELGFFPKQNSTKYYVGIWFKKEKVPIDNIVWVANRKQPVSDSSSAFLTIFKDGNLVVKEGEMVYFVTDIANISTTTTTTRVMLLDSGNLLLLNSSNLNILWQSFDDPTDTLLPGMNLGRDFDSNTSWSLTSWKNAEDPSPGVFSLEVEGGDYMYEKLIIKIKKGSEVYWISDELSNFAFQSYNNRSNTIWNQLGYLTWQGNYTSRLVLEVSGDLNQQFWSQDTNQWVSLQSAKCGRNATCGNFGICNPQAVDPCECLKGFEPYDEDSWNKGDKSAGCVRKTELLCNDLDYDFFRIIRVDLPSNATLDFKTINAPTCQQACSNNCSCVAYAYDFSGHCLLWFDQVLNLKNISVDIGDDNYRPIFFLKLAGSEFLNNVSNTMNNPDHNSNERRKMLIIVIVIVILFGALLTLALFAFYYRRRKLRGTGEDLLKFDVGMSIKVESSEISEVNKVVKVNKKEVKLPFFSFASVSAATDNFSTANKLGEGGFGPVYKAWDLWTSGRGIQLMDSVVEDASINKMEVLRYVNIALLCVQESAAERPSMADVVSLLGNDNAVLPYPKSIAFLNVRGIRNSSSDASSVGNVSINGMTASVMEAR
ncbi:G-type lectin S-receptor-like serine/threonine-protein kinase [Senna tora]|uniref:G-type lectin S-receptor-like serine/threonine-protein kinase n=1 Tax=Senna tora TaxID=362788 RepID=A0A834TKI2_9FABA|nr:G-type lectin S-receptor-like serine/threonine-protein kinase [Senna tora]